MILMSGGTDDGNVIPQVQEIAEILRSADPKPRLGIGLKLPVIFAQQQLMLGGLGDARRNRAHGRDDDHQNRDHERVGGRHHRDHALDAALNGRCAQKSSVSVGGADDRSA
jgi:hypothetical protein